MVPQNFKAFYLTSRTCVCIFFKSSFTINVLLHFNPALLLEWNTWTWTHLPQNASSSDNCNLSFQEISTQEQLKDPCLVVKRFNDIFYTIWPIRIQLEARLTLNVTTFLGFLKTSTINIYNTWFLQNNNYL